MRIAAATEGNWKDVIDRKLAIITSAPNAMTSLAREQAGNIISGSFASVDRLACSSIDTRCPMKSFGPFRISGFPSFKRFPRFCTIVLSPLFFSGLALFRVFLGVSAAILFVLIRISRAPLPRSVANLFTIGAFPQFAFLAVEAPKFFIGSASLRKVFGAICRSADHALPTSDIAIVIMPVSAGLVGAIKALPFFSCVAAGWVLRSLLLIFSATLSATLKADPGCGRALRNVPTFTGLSGIEYGLASVFGCLSLRRVFHALSLTRLDAAT